jgi:TRAP-type mannitol/chloroaromatic compound transport system permease small subunit
VIRRETIEIFIFLKDFYVPLIHTFGDTGTVGVVGIHNGADAGLPQMRDAPLVIISINYVPVIIFSKGIPDGIKKLIWKQMHMKIDYFFGKTYHKQRRLVNLLGDDSVYYIRFLFLSNNWSCHLFSGSCQKGICKQRVNGLNLKIYPLGVRSIYP